ncbi:MAG: hypothetical protein ACRDPV_00660, partial [Gaiellaceae bacterium]
MERFKALGKGTQLMLVGGVLLLIDTIFNWQSVDLPEPLGSVGVSAWDDLGGIIMGLLTIVLIAWIGARLAGIEIPVPFSAALIGAALAVAILALAIIKNLEDEYSSFWAWLGMAFAIVIAVGAWLEIQASGGVEKLKSEIPSMGSSAPAAAAAPE